VNRKTLFAALACALLAFSMLGCGATNHLQSIQLSTSNTKPGTGVGTYINLYGADAPGQFFTWGNYSNGKQKLLYGDGVVYQISITPGSYVLYQGGYIPLTTQYYDPNANPPQVIQLSPSGVVTAVTPFICTWENFATTGSTPSFAYVGSYTVTATYQGFTTPPAFVPVASDVVGIESTTNPDGLCTNPPSAQ
jgi:hypothetical protein